MQVIEKIRDYLFNLDDASFIGDFLRGSSILLSGSSGWGIPEGSDEKADWDIHVILSDERYKEYVSRYGSNHVIDDHAHEPNVFVQIRSISWLAERLGDKCTAVLYLWLYENGTWVEDELGIAEEICRYHETFEKDIEEIAQSHFVRFSVRRLDASSSAKRGLPCAVGMYRGAMVEEALRLFCIASESPYPYDKWLSRQVEMLGGGRLVKLCEEILFEIDMERLIYLFKQVKKEMERLMINRFGDRRWISHWWEFNEN